MQRKERSALVLVGGRCVCEFIKASTGRGQNFRTFIDFKNTFTRKVFFRCSSYCSALPIITAVRSQRTTFPASVQSSRHWRAVRETSEIGDWVLKIVFAHFSPKRFFFRNKMSFSSEREFHSFVPRRWNFSTKPVKILNFEVSNFNIADFEFKSYENDNKHSVKYFKAIDLRATYWVQIRTNKCW